MRKKKTMPATGISNSNCPSILLKENPFFLRHVVRHWIKKDPSISSIAEISAITGWTEIQFYYACKAAPTLRYLIDDYREFYTKPQLKKIEEASELMISTRRIAHLVGVHPLVLKKHEKTNFWQTVYILRRDLYKQIIKNREDQLKIANDKTSGNELLRVIKRSERRYRQCK